MFESLQEKLGSVFKNLRSRGKLTEEDVDVALREVRVALLEADVSLRVVREFIAKVREKAVGEAVWKSLTPGQLVVRFVRDELLELMGNENAKVHLAPQPPTVILMAGLQGAGKTTSAGKLARYFKDKNHRPLLVAADIYRPAAISQLKVLGETISVPVYSMGDKQDPVNICKAAVSQAQSAGNDIVIIDTAGRLHIDEELMDELKRIKDAVKPQEILLVVDSMTGQDAVNIAQNFNSQLAVDGIVLTKLDGDARGGAALSVKAVTGKPVKFVGVGEKLDALEPFYPDRIVSRILGMGDVLGLIEKAEASFSQEQAQELERKFRRAEFTLQDFLDQLQQVKKMGPLRQLLEMIPGFSPAALKDMPIDDKQVGRVEAIIRSMTVRERMDPSILNAGRRRRIAGGSGTTVADVNQLLKQFEMSRKMFKQFADMDKMKKGFPGFKLPF